MLQTISYVTCLGQQLRSYKSWAPIILSSIIITITTIVYVLIRGTVIRNANNAISPKRARKETSNMNRCQPCNPTLVTRRRPRQFEPDRPQIIYTTESAPHLHPSPPSQRFPLLRPRPLHPPPPHPAINLRLRFHLPLPVHPLIIAPNPLPASTLPRSLTRLKVLTNTSLALTKHLSTPPPWPHTLILRLGMVSAPLRRWRRDVSRPHARKTRYTPAKQGLLIVVDFIHFVLETHSPRRFTLALARLVGRRRVVAYVPAIGPDVQALERAGRVARD